MTEPLLSVDADHAAGRLGWRRVARFDRVAEKRRARADHEEVVEPQPCPLRVEATVKLRDDLWRMPVQGVHHEAEADLGAETREGVKNRVGAGSAEFFAVNDDGERQRLGLGLARKYGQSLGRMQIEIRDAALRKRGLL